VIFGIQKYDLINSVGERAKSAIQLIVLLSDTTPTPPANDDDHAKDQIGKSSNAPLAGKRAA
jgi:hypothetical protein